MQVCVFSLLFKTSVTSPCLVMFYVVIVIWHDAKLSKFSETSPISFLVKPVTEEECPRKHITHEKRWRGKGERNMNVCTLYSYLSFYPLPKVKQVQGKLPCKIKDWNMRVIFFLLQGWHLYLWNNWSMKNVSQIRNGKMKKCVERQPEFPELK